MAAAGLPVRDEWIIDGGFSLEGGEEAVERLRALSRQPTALLCANDLMAFGVLRALRAAGRRVPRVMALVGFDDIPLAELVEPPLTTVSRPARDMGRHAFELYFNRFEGKHKRAKQVVLEAALVVRASCGIRTVGNLPYRLHSSAFH